MTPEARARQQIDRKLELAGWLVQDFRQLNLGAGPGVAVREYPTDTGPADYLLFLNREPVGVIEAKPDNTILTFVEEQTARYAGSTLKWRVNAAPLSFLYESTGQVIHFTDGRDPAPRSREVFHFHRPETLADWISQPDTLRRRLAEQMPELPTRNLRDCQVSAVTGLESSLASNKPRALVQMATGAGKTYTAITAVYRLLKFGGAGRILFLVDTRNLGKQAHQEFHAYTPPDDSRTFTELYNMQRLSGNTLDPHAQVCISTIQRMYSMLSNEPIDESAEDVSLNEVAQTSTQAKVVTYNPAIPIESFDFIIIDECHRSIYNLWKQVLDYFDAFLIGLTATPDRRTFGFFNENVVAEYSYEQSVADGVNVSYDVYEIETEITRKGAEVKAKEWVDRRDRLSRKKRWTQLDEDTTYTGKELDRSVVNPNQIRRVIQEMKRAVETEIFPRRRETPKTLIFAKTDSHADDIIQIVREVYSQGNAFCKKVTYTAEDPDSILSSFRNDYNPRIAVTVDMIATGTDVKPLEVLLFMRDVRSRNYYEQMKGRGVRSLGFDELRRVSQSADSAKTRFVLIDAVGVEKSMKTESRLLERKPSVPLKDLLQGVAIGHRDDDTVLSLANRLIRLARELDDKALGRIEKTSGGIPLSGLAKGLLAALDPDRIVEDALATAKAKGITRSEETLAESELQAARSRRLSTACAAFDSPELRDEIESARREREQVIDHINLDQVTFSGYSAEAEKAAQKTCQTFADYITAHKDEIQALSFFYQQPYQRRALTFEMIEDLHDRLIRPPLMLTTERLWSAYARVRQSQVKGADMKRQLTDLISLVRFAIGLDSELRPFSEQVDKRFQEWIFRHKLAYEYSQEPYSRDTHIPKGYDWPSLRSKTGEPLESQYLMVLHKLGNEPGMLGAIFFKAQNKIQDPAKLSRLVQLIDAEDWISLDVDTKGELYEGLLQKNAEDTKSGAGQYFTPRPLIRAMVECLRPEPMKAIADPACGTGGFFLGVYNWLTRPGSRMDKRQKEFLRCKTFYGNEIVAGTRRLCLMNLFLHNIGDLDGEPTVDRSDALLGHPGRHFDYVLANPPFGKKSSMTITNEEGEEDRDALTYERQDFWETTSNKQLNFLQHICTILKDHGQAAVVLPDNVLFEGGAGEKIRRKLLETCDVHTLLRLPTGIFYAQGVKANVLFFDNKPRDGKTHTKGVWVYDLRTNKHFTLKTKPLKFEDLHDFISCYNPENRHERKETERFRYFSYEELIARDKASLDVFWLKDDSLDNLEELPPPEVLAQEIIDHLEAALSSFRDLAAGLADR